LQGRYDKVPMQFRILGERKNAEKFRGRNPGGG
jgi:hypothetical protein